MGDEAVFERDGERFSPGRFAIGPWASDRLHGGPMLGLIARAVEAASPDPAFVLARLSLDMFRPAKAAPLGLELESVRKGSRLALFRVTLRADDGALAQATALFLRASELQTPAGDARPGRLPRGPEGLPTQSLMRGLNPSAEDRPARHAGFHTRVETRWVPRVEGEPLAVWFRLPIPLCAGEPTSPLVAAVALSDFANAIAAIAATERGAAAPYINADATLYLTRTPIGEWFCLEDHGCDTERGISTAEARLYDVKGPIGRALQARLLVR